MYTGPPLTAGIADILMSFRAHKVGLVADIEKAFLNIEVDKQQRDLMCFLWIDDINNEDPNIVTYRFCRVIFSMNCSPFLLNATLKYHVTKYYALEPVLAQNTPEGLYFDDWTSGGENDDEVYAIYKATNACFASGGFNLRKWASNKKEVIEKIVLDRLKKEQLKENEPHSNEDQSLAKMSVGGLDEIDPTKEHKVLGSNWNLAEDTFVLKLSKVVEFARDLEPTKRNVLRITTKLFVLLGLISPVMVVLRMLLQELCLNKSQWDDTISQDQQFRLHNWITDLQRVDNISVNRYYFPGQKTRVKSAVLRGFGDTSRGAYCAVVYLCIESEDGYRTSLVAAKTRVAPSMPMTIPRLELLSTLILARLISAVQEALTQVIHIEEVFCWTDSITVFYWIQSDKEFKQFVQNRIDEIHELTDVKSWRHCPGIENPADIGLRGCQASALMSNSLWWKGPAWLQSSPNNYPKSGAVSNKEPREECSRELKESERNSENVAHATTTVNLTKEPTRIKTIRLAEAIDCEQFSDATKLFSVTALSLKFIRNLKTTRNQRRQPQNIKHKTNPYGRRD